MIIDGFKVVDKVFVPGKIMFSGEYAVLLGNPAISSSLNVYMGIEVTKNNDKVLRIYSSYYRKGLILKSREDILNITSLPLKEALMFCLDQSEINIFQFDLKEISFWEETSGFGASSAIILSILCIFLSYKYDKEYILYHAYNIQKQYQNRASGYDFVTQMNGGVIEYRCLDIEGKKNEMNRFYSIKPVQVNIDINRYLHIFTSKIGSNTSELIKRTLSFFNNEKISKFVEISNDLSSSFLSFLNSSKDKIDENLSKLFDLVDRQQNFFYDIEYYPKVIKELRKNPLYKKDFTIKTTGAGGSDALLLIGDKNKLDSCFNILERNEWNRMIDPFSKVGLYYDS